MDCPKCQSEMEEVVYGKLKNRIAVDRCLACKGIWFDNGEAEALQKLWFAENLDVGDHQVGERHNRQLNAHCPRCNNLMLSSLSDSMSKIRYEYCAEHGMYFDAGEFSRSHYDALMAQFKANASSNAALP
ncbi:MAG: zf-TFIIB domain-containing protein [Pseudomonadales bacterium]|nr:zf-TFIIB domain-containing protein [Pseudomonadales bacterium]